MERFAWLVIKQINTSNHLFRVKYDLPLVGERLCRVRDTSGLLFDDEIGADSTKGGCPAGENNAFEEDRLGDQIILSVRALWVAARAIWVKESVIVRRVARSMFAVKKRKQGRNTAI